MRQKALGQSGLLIPEVGLGTWSYQGGPEPLRRGLEAGAAFLDTAESYGTEPVVADAVAGQRDRVFLATKVAVDHLRYRDVIAAAEGSLQRLRVDCIDLYQVHEPSLSVPLEETMGALEDLVAAGKVRFLGVSNFSVPQLERAQRALRKNRLAANQVRYNLADRTIEQGLLAYCQAQRITVIAYSPLARRFSDLVDCDPTGALAEVARVTGKTPAQIAINWCLCQEGVVAIPKGNSVAHVLENCGASDWRLSAEQRQLLAARVRFRRRSGLETLLRRLLPRGAKQALQRAVRALPAGMRRGLN